MEPALPSPAPPEPIAAPPPPPEESAIPKKPKGAVLLNLGTPKPGVDRRRAPYFRTRKVAIIGCTDSHRHAPWTDPSWTILSHCSAKSLLKREPDWWFDLHPSHVFTQRKRWNQTYYRWLQMLTTPIFMQEAWDEIPQAVKFPLERLLAEFRPYFTNHVALMIALAMTEGITHIGLFGCEYSHDSERSRQRGSCEYWLGRFEERGGHLVLPRSSSLLAFPKGLYGYQSHDETGKLTPEYTVAPTVKVGKEVRELQLINPDSAEGRVPLMKPPEGIDINWKDSGHKIWA